MITEAVLFVNFNMLKKHPFRLYPTGSSIKKKHHYIYVWMMRRFDSTGYGVYNEETRMRQHPVFRHFLF